MNARAETTAPALNGQEHPAPGAEIGQAVADALNKTPKVKKPQRLKKGQYEQPAIWVNGDGSETPITLIAGGGPAKQKKEKHLSQADEAKLLDSIKGQLFALRDLGRFNTEIESPHTLKECILALTDKIEAVIFTLPSYDGCAKKKSKAYDGIYQLGSHVYGLKLFMRHHLGVDDGPICGDTEEGEIIRMVVFCLASSAINGFNQAITALGAPDLTIGVEPWK